jgi:flagellar basal body P-ring formation protein FlgA
MIRKLTRAVDAQPELSARHFAALTALACLILFGMTLSAALAQTRLRPIVQVEGDVVRLGDLVDGAGDKADLALFGAPQPGASGMISSGRIVAAARDHGIAGIDTNGLSTVTVRRTGRTIGADEIARAVRDALIAQHALPVDTEIELNAGQMEVIVETAARDGIVVRSLSYNGASGRFEATYVSPGSRALELNPAKVVGSISDIIRVPVLTRAILKGDVITQQDVSIERRRRSELGGEVMTDIVRIAGNAARRPMGRGSMIREGDVQRPEVVERNATILMTFEQPGLQLTMRGRALQGGAIGDTIQAQNLNSKRTVEAVVTGPNRVAVTGAVIGQPQKTTSRSDVRAQ